MDGDDVVALLVRDRDAQELHGFQTDRRGRERVCPASHSPPT